MVSALSSLMVRPPGRASQAEQLRVATEKQLRPLREELDAVQAGHGRRSRSRAGRSESLGRIRIYKAEWPAAEWLHVPVAAAGRAGRAGPSPAGHGAVGWARRRA